MGKTGLRFVVDRMRPSPRVVDNLVRNRDLPGFPDAGDHPHRIQRNHCSGAQFPEGIEIGAIIDEVWRQFVIVAVPWQHQHATAFETGCADRRGWLAESRGYLVDFARIRKCLEAQERGDRQVILWGDGSPTREFLYAEDAAEGLLLATERYNGSEPFNLGSGQEISIRDLADLVARLTGFEGEIYWDTSKPNGQPRRALDTQRAKDFFGFEAQMPLEEGLLRTITWYRESQTSDGAQ